jgi:hypothetical protein
VQVEVQPNLSGAARATTMTIAGQTVSVTQAQVVCSYTVAPTSIAEDRAGGNESVAVTTQQTCAWTAVSNVTWITITSGAAGTGSGTVKMKIADTREDRQGTLTVAGQTVTVSQSGTKRITIF